MIDALSLYFTGLLPIIWKFGAWGFVIAGALAWAWFMPIFKKTALWVAVGAAVVLVTYSVGVKDGSDRVKAQWAAALENEARHGEGARESAERAVRAEPPASVRDDVCNRDNWRSGQQAC